MNSSDTLELVNPFYNLPRCKGLFALTAHQNSHPIYNTILYRGPPAFTVENADWLKNKNWAQHTNLPPTTTKSLLHFKLIKQKCMYYNIPMYCQKLQAAIVYCLCLRCNIAAVKQKWICIPCPFFYFLNLKYTFHSQFKNDVTGIYIPLTPLQLM